MPERIDQDVTNGPVNHSAGEWSICNDGKCPCLMVSVADHPICTVESGEWGDTYPSLRFTKETSGMSIGKQVEAYTARINYGHIPKEEALANARLITAAPDLLVACKAALGAFERNDCIDWNDLVSAIAKAEGTKS